MGVTNLASRLDLASLRCAGCDKSPPEIRKYVILAAANEKRAAVYVWENETTLHRETGAFLCGACLHLCQKLRLEPKWIATPENLTMVLPEIWGHRRRFRVASADVPA